MLIEEMETRRKLFSGLRMGGRAVRLTAVAKRCIRLSHWCGMVNFCKSHGAIRMTPAQAAGVESSQCDRTTLFEPGFVLVGGHSS